MRADAPSTTHAPRPPARRRITLGHLLVGLTLIVCATAIYFRAELRARWWAARLVRATDLRERAHWLQALANAGSSGRWGVATLLTDGDPQLRQMGLLALHADRSDWALQRLLMMRGDPDESVRGLVALGLARLGQSSIIPELMADFRSGAPERVDVACMALERLGTSASYQALAALAETGGDPDACARLIDALEGCPDPAAEAALLRLCADTRSTRAPTRRERLARALAGAPLPPAIDIGTEAGPSPATSAASRSVGSLAAAALQRLRAATQPITAPQPAAP